MIDSKPQVFLKKRGNRREIIFSYMGNPIYVIIIFSFNVATVYTTFLLNSKLKLSVANTTMKDSSTNRVIIV